MSEFKDVDDRKFGQYVLNSSIDLSGSNINAEELANACRRLGISGPLEPLLRDLKIKNEKYVSPVSPAHHNKDSPQRKTTSQRKEGGKRLSSQCKRHSPDYHLYEHSDSAKGSAGGGGGGGGGGGYGKNSYGKESWGRDSGARDLSPEPNSMHRMHETLTTENQPSMDTETGGGGGGCGGISSGGGGGGGGTSAMLHLASKVSLIFKF